MRWADVPFHPTDRVLRQFAGLWLLVFLGLAGWEGAVRGRPWVAGPLAIAALTVGLPGLASPRFIKLVFVAWMVLAFPIGWALSWLLLGFVFFGVITPVALVLRLLGHDPLALARAPETSTYWRPKPAVVDVRRYFRQY